MADEATTSDAADSQAQDDEVGQQASDVATGTTLGSAQPEPADKQTEAVKSKEETTTQPETAKTKPDKTENLDEDAEIKEWATKKNLPLDDPIAMAKMVREGDRKVSEAGKEKSQLKSAVETANSTNSTEDVQALRNEVAALNFYIQNPDAKAYEAKMVEILDEKPWLAGDLETVLLAAKGSAATTELVAERQAGKKEALETVAASERAAPPRASATTRETPKEITDADIGNMTQKEYAEWKAAGNDPYKIAA